MKGNKTLKIAFAIIISVLLLVMPIFYTLFRMGVLLLSLRGNIFLISTITEQLR